MANQFQGLEGIDEAMDPISPLAHTQQMVLRQAEELKELLDDIEGAISYRSKEMADLCAARDILAAALMGTEKVRAQSAEGLDDVLEDEKPVSKRPTRRTSTQPRRKV